MQNSRGWTACSEESFFVTRERETRIAGRERTFTAQGWGHIVGGKWTPMFAVSRLQQEKFAVDGIAEGKALFLGTAGDGVEKKFLAIVRILQIPGFAAVGGFVNAGFFAFADGHEVGRSGVK